jgi:hypothetical protein
MDQKKNVISCQPSAINLFKIEAGNKTNNAHSKELCQEIKCAFISNIVLCKTINGCNFGRQKSKIMTVFDLTLQ